MSKSNQAILKNLGQAMQTQRKSLGLTQLSLAELANVGPNYIRQIEAGKPTAHIEKVLDVMAALGLQFKLEFGKEKIKL
jgi:HTH-type transcriptional regulator / antitoxin HipB